MTNLHRNPPAPINAQCKLCGGIHHYTPGRRVCRKCSDADIEFNRGLASMLTVVNVPLHPRQQLPISQEAIGQMVDCLMEEML